MSLDAPQGEDHRGRARAELLADGHTARVMLGALPRRVVGDIEDEYDFDETADNIRIDQAGRYRVKASTEIEDFNDFFGTQFSDEEVDTVGGLVMHAFSHLPKKGEEIELDGYLFKVMHADRRRLQQLQVKIPENHAAAQPES